MSDENIQQDQKPCYVYTGSAALPNYGTIVNLSASAYKCMVVHENKR